MMCCSYQCSRKACRNADRPSITRRIVTVRTAKAANSSTSTSEPIPEEIFRPTWRTIRQSTSDSSADETPLLHFTIWHPEMDRLTSVILNRFPFSSVDCDIIFDIERACWSLNHCSLKIFKNKITYVHSAKKNHPGWGNDCDTTDILNLYLICMFTGIYNNM